MKTTKARKARKIEAAVPASVAPIAAVNPGHNDDPGLGWLAANIQGRLRGIAGALDDIANGADFKDDREAWLVEVLISALEREADRLEELESRVSALERAGAA